ncbi:KdsC family phosphatase [Guyparkeria sp.]|uniref:KdsC family phosphatase n=1 Tax=Guyparkeria sp. TaxID=2035736 RepID=UPI0035656099
MMNRHDSTWLERARGIRLLVLDVDGVMTDGRLHMTEGGDEHKIFHSRDGHGIKLIQALGVDVAIITGRSSPAVSRRAADLGIQHVVLGATDKGQAIEELAQLLDLELAEVAAMGDDVLDLPMLNRAGLSATVADAPPVIRSRVDWISPLPGGHGAVRALIDTLIDARGEWAEILSRYS